MLRLLLLLQMLLKSNKIGLLLLLKLLLEEGEGLHPVWLLLTSVGLSSLSTILVLLLLLLRRWDPWVGPGWVVPSHFCGGLLVDLLLQLVPESLLSGSRSPGSRKAEIERGGGDAAPTSRRSLLPLVAL